MTVNSEEPSSIHLQDIHVRSRITVECILSKIFVFVSEQSFIFIRNILTLTEKHKWKNVAEVKQEIVSEVSRELITPQDARHHKNNLRIFYAAVCCPLDLRTERECLKPLPGET